MAITILDQPTANVFQSVGNPIELLLSSNQTGQSNYKFNVRIYYDPGGANTLLATLKYDILPGTTQALVNIAPIIQSKIAENITNLRTSASGVKNETTKWHTANVVVNDFYGAIPVMISSGSATSNTILDFNGALKYLGWAKGDLANYRITGGGGQDLTKKLLTNFANGISVSHVTVQAAPATYFRNGYNIKKVNSSQLSQIAWLWQGTGGTNSAIEMAVHKTDFSAVLVKSSTLASVQALQSLNVGVDALIALGGTFANITSAYTWIQLSVWNATVQLSQTYLFEIDWTPCAKFETFQIHWLNRYGGWDSWVFNKRSRHATDIKRNEYNPTRIPIASNLINHNTYDITGRNNIIQTKETYQLNSGLLRAWELTGLEDLLTSPSVYWNSSDGFINIVPMNPNVHEHKTNTVDKLFNMSFEFEIDNQDIRQLP